MKRATRRGWVGLGMAALCVAALGPLFAQGRGGGPGGGSKPDPKARQERPIQLGVSGGNATDIANGFCCSGTLGALVENATGQFILSNSHVFAGDIAGADQAEIGDPINQSGLIDAACQNRPEDYVAHLSSESSINPGGVSPVDAAIAKVIDGMVRTDGAILGIGTIGSSPIAASVNQSVKKSGRTTGLTSSRVEAVNATISVGYTNECGGTSFTSMYTGQIIVANRGQKFLAGGDSGSMMVENASTNPRAIGLLFAGSSSIAVANPISDVLNYHHVTLVGQASGTSLDAPNDAVAQATARAIAAQERNAARLITVPGAVGHAVGVPENANAVVIKVYVPEITARARQALPNELEGVPVVLEAVGQVIGLGAKVPCNQPKK